jgi:hypothetical protein
VRLRDKSNHYNELSAKAKDDATKRREQFTNILPDSRKQIDELQNNVELSSTAQSRADEFLKKIVEAQKQLEAGQKSHRSPQALKAIRVNLGKLTAAKQEADRDAREKTAKLASTKRTTELKAAEYASHLIEIHNLELDAERASKCASDSANVANQLGSKLTELQDQLKKEHLKNEIEISKTLLEDVTEFAKTNPNLIPLEAASLVTQLKQAMRGTDLGAISDAKEKLQSRLKNVPGFREFVEERDKARTKTAAIELAAATDRVRTISDFLQRYARSNITDEAVSSLLKLNEELARALLAPRSDTLNGLANNAEVELSRQGLVAQYVEFKRTHKPRISLSDLTKTDINGFLVEGPDDELVFLINNTGHGNATRNLHGKIVFVDGKATVCLAHPFDDFDRFTLLQIGLEVEAKGASKVSLSGDPCPIDPVGTYDVIVIDRDHWLRTSKETVQVLLDGVEKGELSKFAVLSKSEIKDRANQESVESLELQTKAVPGLFESVGFPAGSE